MDYRKKLAAAAKLTGTTRATLIHGATRDAIEAGVGLPDFVDGVEAAGIPLGIVPNHCWDRFAPVYGARFQDVAGWEGAR